MWEPDDFLCLLALAWISFIVLDFLLSAFPLCQFFWPLRERDWVGHSTCSDWFSRALQTPVHFSQAQHVPVHQVQHRPQGEPPHELIRPWAELCAHRVDEECAATTELTNGCACHWRHARNTRPAIHSAACAYGYNVRSPSLFVPTVSVSRVFLCLLRCHPDYPWPVASSSLAWVLSLSLFFLTS